jgi:CcmD family protein
MTSKLGVFVRASLVVLATTLITAFPVGAQQGASALAGQSLRPYHFVFLAYALAWILVFGWVISIGRRISTLADRLGE